MQSDLFNFQVQGSSTDSSKLAATGSRLDRFRFTLRLDHLSFLTLLALVLYALVFSFGVEKGKRIAQNEFKETRARRVSIAQQKTPVLNESTAPAAAAALPPISAMVSSQPLSATDAPAPAVNSVSGTEIETSPIPIAAGKYTIQVVTLLSKARAEAEIQKFKEKGMQGFIIPSGKYFQVCLQSFEKMTDAKKALGSLKNQGFAPEDAYIRPLKGQIAISS